MRTHTASPHGPIATMVYTTPALFVAGVAAVLASNFGLASAVAMASHQDIRVGHVFGTSCAVHLCIHCLHHVPSLSSRSSSKEAFSETRYRAFRLPQASTNYEPRTVRQQHVRSSAESLSIFLTRWHLVQGEQHDSSTALVAIPLPTWHPSRDGRPLFRALYNLPP
jgi:hypothetical protein